MVLMRWRMYGPVCLSMLVSGWLVAVFVLLPQLSVNVAANSRMMVVFILLFAFGV